MLEPLLFGSDKHHSLISLCPPMIQCVVHSGVKMSTKQEGKDIDTEEYSSLPMLSYNLSLHQLFEIVFYCFHC